MRDGFSLKKALLCISLGIIHKIISKDKTGNVIGMILEKVLVFGALRLKNTEEKVQGSSQITNFSFPVLKFI